jgi:hypothetical protein
MECNGQINVVLQTNRNHSHLIQLNSQTIWMIWFLILRTRKSSGNIQFRCKRLKSNKTWWDDWMDVKFHDPILYSLWELRYCDLDSWSAKHENTSEVEVFLLLDHYAWTQRIEVDNCCCLWQSNFTNSLLKLLVE